MDPAMKEAFEFLLERRDIETPCPTCSGLGVRTYGSTAGWMGGMGGQMLTSGVCDKCWGSGDKHRAWPSWKEMKAIRDENKRLKAELEKPERPDLRALLAKHGVDIDDLPESNDPILFGPPVYLGDDEELIRRSRR